MGLIRVLLCLHHCFEGARVGLHDHTFRDELAALISRATDRLPSDSVVAIRIHGNVTAEAMAVLRAPFLRSISPGTMNVSVTLKDQGR